MIPPEIVASGRVLMENAWLVSPKPTCLLHHAVLTEEQYQTWIDSGELVETEIRLTCGRPLLWPSVPVISQRVSSRRCATCCQALGYPRGLGAPLRDPRCQEVLMTRLMAVQARRLPVSTSTASGDRIDPRGPATPL